MFTATLLSFPLVHLLLLPKRLCVYVKSSQKRFLSVLTAGEQQFFEIPIAGTVHPNFCRHCALGEGVCSQRDVIVQKLVQQTNVPANRLPILASLYLRPVPLFCNFLSQPCGFLFTHPLRRRHDHCV